eukprot:1152582-Pelagomonas_calceolata.AAC.2
MCEHATVAVLQGTSIPPKGSRADFSFLYIASVEQLQRASMRTFHQPKSSRIEGQGKALVAARKK